MKYLYTFYKATFLSSDEIVFVLVENSKGQLCSYCAEVDSSPLNFRVEGTVEEWLGGLVSYYELGADPCGYTYQKLHPEPFLTHTNRTVRNAAKIATKNEATET